MNHFLCAHMVRRHVRVGLALFLLLVAGSTMAATPKLRVELQAGRSYTESTGTATVFVEGIFAERRIGSSRFSWAPDLSAGWINGRRMPRYRHDRYTMADSIWLAAAGARFRYGTENDWYHHLFFSFQPALHTGKTRALSSAYEFVSTAGWQGRRFSVQVRHFSNGSLHEPNCGETMLLFGVRLH